MEGNTTVAVDILIRTTLGSAGSDFNKFFASLERQAKDWVTRINKILAGVKFNMPNAPAGSNTPRTPSGSRGDPAMAAAMRDIQKLQAQRLKLETDYTNHVNKQTEARYQAYIKGVQKIATGTAAELNKAQQSTSGHSFFSSTFWGTLGGNVSSYFLNRLSQIPSDLKGILDESIKIAQDRQNAFAGLSSVATAKGVGADQAVAAVKNLRLVKAGIVDVGQATTSLKNLLATGFSLPESIKLFEAFSDSAAFGKQAALDYGEAIRGATEGIKNQNSILVDNSGITKNLSVILEEQGKTKEDLSKVTQDVSVRTALYNGLLKEASIFSGDANKLTMTYTGSVAALDMAQKNLLNTVGKQIIQNPELLQSNKELTDQYNKLTDATNDSNSATANFVDKATDLWAEFRVSVTGNIGSIITAVAAMVTGLATGLGAILTAVVAPFDAVASGIEYTVNKVRNAVVDMVNYAIDTVQQHPWIAATLGAGGAALLNAQHAQRFEAPEAFSTTKELARATANLATATRDLYNLSNKLGGEARRAEFRVANARVDTSTMDDLTYERYRQRLADRNIPLSGAPDRNNPPPDTGGTKKGRMKKEDFQPSSDAQALIEASARLGIRPIDLATIIAYETRGTFSPAVKGGAGNNYLGLLQFGASERQQFGANANQSFSQQLLNSAVPFLQSRFAGVGRSTEGASLSDLYRTVIGGNPNVPLTARDQNGAIFQHLQRMSGTAKQQALARFFGGSEANIRAATGGEDFADFQKEERELRRKAILARVQAAGTAQVSVTSEGAGIGRQVSARPSLDQEYIKSVRERLGLEQRYTEYVFRERNLQAEIAENIESYNLSLKEGNSQAKIDLELAKARNVEAETTLDYQRSVNALLNESKDIEKESALLRLQNQDEAFQYQRRANEAAKERLDYERDISDLQDKLSNQGMNDQLKVQRDLLQDILDIRERETDAIVEGQRAQLEIAEQTRYSATQANAQVLRFMANQKGVTEAVADFKIGLIESGYDVIDKGLDSILPKMGRLTSVVHDLLSSFIKLALNAAFRRIFGLDGGAGAGGGAAKAGGVGGGFLSFINKVFGGGGGQGSTASAAGGAGSFGFPNFGGGVGVGGTAGFNPNAGLFGGQSPFRVPTSFGSFSGGTGTLGTGAGVTGADLLSSGGAGATGGGQYAGLLGAINNLPQGGVGANYPTSGIRTPRAVGTYGNQLSGALLGASLGVGLGGQSRTGQLLGGAGGAIAGTLLYGLATTGSIAGATTGGIFGASAGLLGLSGAATFGIGLAIGGALLLGSYLFGRAERRKKEKKEVTNLSGDVVQRIQQLISDVQHFKIDGASAVAQAKDLLEQFKQQTAQLKTKPGKALAQQKIAMINQLISQLQGEADKADRLQKVAAITDEKLVPTFAIGGMGSAFTGYGGGAFSAALHPSEAVLRSNEIYALGGYRKLQQVGVRGAIGSESIYERSYNSARSNGAGNWSGKSQDVYVVGVFDPSTADDILDQVSNLGFAKKVKFVASKNIAQVVDSIETTMAGKQ